MDESQGQVGRRPPRQGGQQMPTMQTDISALNTSSGKRGRRKSSKPKRTKDTPGSGLELNTTAAQQEQQREANQPPRIQYEPELKHISSSFLKYQIDGVQHDPRQLLQPVERHRFEQADEGRTVLNTHGTRAGS